jgi:hypothetical protein
MRSFFYDVPEGVTALRVDVEQSAREVAVAIVRPDTRTADAVRTAGGGGGGGFGGFGGGAARRATYTVSDPMPGVWEVRLSDLADVNTFDAMQAESDEPVPPTPVTLTISAIAVDLAVAANGALAQAARDVQVTGSMAPFKGAVAGLPMGAARRERPTVAQNQQLEYELDVPEGAASLLVRVGDTSDPLADLDVYVLNCTGEECRMAETDSDPLGDEVVTVQNPAAGKWKVIVDGAHVPAGRTAFSYLDVIFNPAFGAVNSADVAKEHKAGEPWTAVTHTWIAGGFPAGREPFAAVRLEGELSAGTRFPLGLLELGGAETLQQGAQR